MISPFLLGVDGCKGGWVAAAQRISGGAIEVAVHRNFRAVLAWRQPLAAVAVDMPIGLCEGGVRQCDTEARRLLGPRRSSVFPPPYRSALKFADDYATANEHSKRTYGHGLSKQAFYLMPRIREVDFAVRSKLAPVYECHPELAFLAMNGGRPIAQYKRTKSGQSARRRLLQHAFGEALGSLLRDKPPAGCALDDLYDALACLWSARRIHRGEAVGLPASPPLDAVGLPMAIHY